MNETPHPAVVARRRRLHQLRVRIATGVVGLFIAIFSVIYAQAPAAKVTTASNRVASASTGSSSSSASISAATPMTTTQS